MKKLFIFLFVCALLPFTVSALTDEEETNILIPESQTVDDNYVKAGYIFDLRGQFKGDVIVVGSSVDISGKVEGDVIAAAANITISGEVLGNVRVAGSNVTINGKVGKNVNIFAATAELGKGSQVGGSAVVFAGTANFKGTITGKIDGGAGNIVISGTVKKDITLRFDTGKQETNYSNLSVMSTAVIEGNLNYYGWNMARIDSGAKISGQVTRHEPASVVKETKDFYNSLWWFVRIAGLFGLLIVGLVIINLFKKQARETPVLMLKSPGRCMLRGLAILFLTPVVCFFLLFTVIGIPLALIVMVLYVIIIYTAQIFIGLFIGQKILAYFQKRSIDNMAEKKEISLFWSMVLGVFAYLLVTEWLLSANWPGVWGWFGFLGGLVKFVALIWVLGAIYLQKREKTMTVAK